MATRLDRDNLIELLFDRMPMGIAVFDRELRLLRSNPTWASFIGRYTPTPASEVRPGRTLYELAPGSEASIGPVIERVLAGETLQLDAFRSESGGIVSYWDVVFSPLWEDGNVAGVVDVVTDATERVQARAELEASLAALAEREERLARIVQATTDGIWEWNLSDDTFFFSPRWLAMLGYDEAELPPRASTWRELIHPEDREQVEAALRAHLRGDAPTFRVEHRSRHKDGSYRWLLARGQVVRAADGEPLRLTGANADIGERKEAEQRLEARVRERTQALTTLLDVTHNLTSTLQPEALLGAILDQLKQVVDYTGATILRLQGDALVVQAHRGPIAPAAREQIRFPLAEAASRDVVLERRSLIIPDVSADSELARAYRRTASPELAPLFDYVHSWLAVPLAVHDQVIGVLSLDHAEPNYYTPHHVEIALAFANQAAVAIENARLFAAARQRADEAQTLFSVQQAITSRLDPDAVLQMIADEARRLTGTDMGAVYLLEGDELVISVVSGNVDRSLLGYRLDVAGSVAGEAIRTGKSFLIADVSTAPHVHAALVADVGAAAFVVTPLLAGGEPVGTITVANKREGALGEEDLRVLTMLASGAAIALENARLFASVEAHSRRLEALYRADEELHRHLRMGAVLDALVDVAVDLLHADKSSMMIWDEAHAHLVVRAARGFQRDTVARMRFGPGEGIIARAAAEGKPIIVEDVALEPHVARTITDAEGIRSFMHVPIEIGEHVFGVFNVSYTRAHAFDEDEQRLFAALAQRAAIAIENSRLYERAQEAAAVEERNRLARELHDAVTQTLFSASLIADVLPQIWERDEAQGRKRLVELRELTRGALAEMRALLLELRPATLTEVPLAELLRQLVAATTGRARLPVALEVDGECQLPPTVQVALYRIAQESLNNVVRHAHAEAATITLYCAPDGVTLRVADDGRGFSPDEVGHDSLGLSIMRERAARIGATLQIKSGGAGTTVLVTWSSTDE